LHSTKWNDCKKKKGRKPYSSKNYSMEDSVENEENGYLVPDSNKTMINVTTKKSLKEDIFEEIT
jgi:predicted RND superfamily exporter protein